MRIPGFMLDKTVQVERLGKSKGRGGSSFADPTAFRCHYEDKGGLKIDQRVDSPTFGQVIAMSAQCIGQLDRSITPGARVTIEGQARIVGYAKHFEHSQAPSNTELWVV